MDTLHSPRQSLATIAALPLPITGTDLPPTSTNKFPLIHVAIMTDTRKTPHCDINSCNFDARKLDKPTRQEPYDPIPNLSSSDQPPEPKPHQASHLNDSRHSSRYNDPRYAANEPYRQQDPTPAVRLGKEYVQFADPLQFELSGQAEHPRCSPEAVSGTTEMSFVDKLLQPKTPPPTLPASNPETLCKPAVRQILPLTLPEALKYVSNRPPAVLPSSIPSKVDDEEQKKLEPILKDKGKQRKLVTPFKGEFDTQKFKIELQIITKKLESAIQDLRMNKGKGGPKVGYRELRMCKKHEKWHFCDSEEKELPETRYAKCAEDLIKKAKEEAAVSVPKPKIPASQVASELPLSEIPVLKLDKVGNEAGKTIPGKSCTDPNRFVDFADRQCATRALQLQHEHADKDAFLRKQAKCMKECENLLERTKKSETHWRSEVHRISKKLVDIEKYLEKSQKTFSNKGKEKTVKEELISSDMGKGSTLFCEGAVVAHQAKLDAVSQSAIAAHLKLTPYRMLRRRKQSSL